MGSQELGPWVQNSVFSTCCFVTCHDLVRWVSDSAVSFDYPGEFKYSVVRTQSKFLTKLTNIFKSYLWPGAVAHVYNPSYSRGRDQEDADLRPAWANSSRDPIFKIPITKKGWWGGSSGRAPA
jgi:hypothetical protein